MMRASFTPQPRSVVSRALAVGHLLSHIEQEPAIRFLDLAKQPAKTAQIARIFPGAAPCDVVRALPLREIWKYGRLFAIIKHLVEGHFHGTGQLFERLNGWNSMTIFDARNVATEQACALFDVALGKFFCFTE